MLTMKIQKHNYEAIYTKYLASGEPLKSYCINNNLNYIVISRYFKSHGFSLMPYIRNHVLSDELVLTIHKDHYNNFLSRQELSQKYNISGQLIQRNFKRLKLPLIHNLRSSNTKVGFLQSIDSPLKAYLLGWLYSDGSVAVGKGIALSIAAEDVDVLKLFHSEFGGNMYFVKRRQPHYKDQYKLVFSSLLDEKFLISHGCNPNKSVVGMRFPNIDEWLYRYFILGFFDGDGTIYKSARNIKVKFMSTDKKFLEKIQSILYAIGCENFYWDLNAKVHHLVVGNKKSKSLIRDYFYNDNPYFLERKKQKFFELTIPRETL